MEYRLIRNDELYHYGVPGMRWGHRKAVPDSYASSKAQYKAAKRAFNRSHSRAYNYSAFHLMSQFTNPGKKAKADKLWEQAKKDGKKFNAAQKEYKREKARTADQRAAARKERVKTAAKIGAAAGAAALAAYGGYKVYKLQGDAVTSLGKKYSSLSKQYMDLVDLNRKTARSQANQADKYKLLAGYVQKNEPGNKWEADAYRKAAKNLMKTSNESDVRAEKRLEEAMNYYSKAKSKDFSKKEVAREMIDIAKRRKKNDW